MNEEDIYILEKYIDLCKITGMDKTKSTAIEHLLQAYKEQEKVIDEMAKYMSTLDIDEDMCSKLKNPCSEEDDCYLDVYDKCGECIKQYFINKVKDIGGK